MEYLKKSSKYRNNFELVLYNKQFKRMNEILYVFYSADELALPFISKIGVQKCIYMAEVLSPLKEIVMAFLNFIYHYKGPYSKDIQNILDHLVSMNAIEVVSFSSYGESSYVNYKITNEGKSLVGNLIYDPVEKEKLDWIKIIMKLIDIYKDAFGLSEDYCGLDKIINLVYQDPSFYNIKQQNKKGELIPMGNNNTLTMELIYFLGKVEESLPKYFEKERYKLNLEGILLTFFEYLYVEYLSEKVKI